MKKADCNNCITACRKRVHKHMKLGDPCPVWQIPRSRFKLEEVCTLNVKGQRLSYANMGVSK